MSSEPDPRQAGSEKTYAEKIVKVLDSEMEVLVFERESKGLHSGLIVCQHILVAHAGFGGGGRLGLANVWPPPATW